MSALCCLYVEVRTPHGWLPLELDTNLEGRLYVTEQGARILGVYPVHRDDPVVAPLRGVPVDLSQKIRAEFDDMEREEVIIGSSWITLDELDKFDWQQPTTRHVYPSATCARILGQPFFAAVKELRSRTERPEDVRLVFCLCN